MSLFVYCVIICCFLFILINCCSPLEQFSVCCFVVIVFLLSFQREVHQQKWDGVATKSPFKMYMDTVQMIKWVGWLLVLPRILIIV